MPTVRGLEEVPCVKDPSEQLTHCCHLPEGIKGEKQLVRFLTYYLSSSALKEVNASSRFILIIAPVVTALRMRELTYSYRD